jgi:hypothetical protein
MVTRQDEGATGCPVTPQKFWSGRPDSNRRRPAWETGSESPEISQALPVVADAPADFPDHPASPAATAESTAESRQNFPPCPWCDGTGERVHSTTGTVHRVPCAPCKQSGDADHWQGPEADDWRQRARRTYPTGAVRGAAKRARPAPFNSGCSTCPPTTLVACRPRCWRPATGSPAAVRNPRVLHRGLRRGPRARAAARVSPPPV